MIWTARPDTTLDFVNATCVEFIGMPPEQLLGEGGLNAVHPQDLDHTASVYVPAIQARLPFIMEYRLRRADGAYRWDLDTGVPKLGADGNYAGYIGCSVDITERKEGEDRIRESGAALEVSHRDIQQLAGWPAILRVPPVPCGTGCGLRDAAPPHSKTARESRTSRSLLRVQIVRHLA
jgi:PAS domain S-box-containing protein